MFPLITRRGNPIFSKARLISVEPPGSQVTSLSLSLSLSLSFCSYNSIDVILLS